MYKRVGKLNYLNEKRAEQWEQKTAELKWAKVEAFCIKYKDWGRKKIPSEILMIWKHALSIHKNPMLSVVSGHDLIPG